MWRAGYHVNVFLRVRHPQPPELWDQQSQRVKEKYKKGNYSESSFHLKDVLLDFCLKMVALKWPFENDVSILVS